MFLGDSIQDLFLYLLCIIYVLLEVVNLFPFLLGLQFPLFKIPGPRLAGWTRIWWVKALYYKNTAHEMVELDKKYGPVVRISPNSILISDPETTRQVLGVGSNFARGPWFDSLRLDPYLTNVVSERDPKKNQQMRSILSAGLSGKDISLEATVKEHVHKWISILDNKITSTHGREATINLSASLNFLTLDIITDLCLGESFHCLEGDADPYGFLKALRTGMATQPYISILLELKDILLFFGRFDSIRSRLFPNRKDDKGIGKVMQIIHEAVERRLDRDNKEGSFKQDMLDSFLSRGLTLQQASTELAVVLTSGVGSTSYAAQGIIHCIASNPHVLQRLQSEIDHTITRESLGQHNNIKDSTLSEMPYLQACIAEGLRMYPPISLLRERTVPSPGVALHGYRIPGGTFIGLNTLATQLKPVYGARPEEFHPERWLIDNEAQLKQMHRSLELVFGYGASKCLGVNIAKTELNRFIFEIFRMYRISLALEVPWQRSSDLLLSGFEVRIERRERPVETNGVRTP